MTTATPPRRHGVRRCPASRPCPRPSSSSACSTASRSPSTSTALPTTAPVRDAQIELEIGGAKFKAEKHGDDEYEVVLPEAPKPGVLPITATVTAGTEVDLLAGELDHARGRPHRRGQRTRTPGRSTPDGPLAAWPSLAVLVFGGGRRDVLSAQRSRRRCSMKRASLHRLAWLGVVLALVRSTDSRRPAKAMTTATHPQRPAPTARSASPTAACSCPSRHSASWECARWSLLRPSCRARSS